jgi:protein gp37
MSANTKIEWCDHTFNPWIGCTKVSPGCANCYAEAHDRRFGGSHWGKGAPRKRTSSGNWNQPLKWNRDEEAKLVSHEEFVRNRRPRVFCASLADWLDDVVPIGWLADLLDLIRRTPSLDWLLLTKRPGNWEERLRAVCVYLQTLPGGQRHTELPAWQLCNEWLPWNGIHRFAPPKNIWIGTTVEDQQRADERIPALLKIPAKIRFLSCEPLLGPVDLKLQTEDAFLGPIHWVICGGESGPNARPMHPVWARDLRDQCAAAGTPFFFKQWGEWIPFGMGTSYMQIFKEAKLLANGPGATGWPVYRVGKKLAGRLIDDREHSEFPI